MAAFLIRDSATFGVSSFTVAWVQDCYNCMTHFQQWDLQDVGTKLKTLAFAIDWLHGRGDSPKSPRVPKGNASLRIDMWVLLDEMRRYCFTVDARLLPQHELTTSPGSVDPCALQLC